MIFSDGRSDLDGYDYCGNDPIEYPPRRKRDMLYVWGVTVSDYFLHKACESDGVRGYAYWYFHKIAFRCIQTPGYYLGKL